ncbi:MAG: FecR domain-containing protein [Opitutales bacterium]
MSILRLSLLAVFAIALSSLSLAAQQLATAKVINVTGTVTKYLANGESQQLSAGDLLREGDAVSATALSSADLVFSNGSELTIEENTSVNFAALKQQAFSGNKRFEALDADPSTSQTLLELNYGSVSGHVKKLRSDSSFEVETPLGTAAVRGTRFIVSLIFDTERQEFMMSVDNIDGLVDVISKYVGSVEYGSSNIGDKGFKSGLEEEKREQIPAKHKVIVRLQRTDPFFDVLIKRGGNVDPKQPTPTVTPGTKPGDGDDEDFGIIVSPEGPQGSIDEQPQ